MARVARVVAVGIPHHITQRGNNQQMVFSGDQDRRTYLRILKHRSAQHGLTLLGYCLMNNHVHLIATPLRANSLALVLGRTHNDYARWVHVRRSTTGHLWQNRFYSCPMGETHTWRALRYVEFNPVRAAIVDGAGEWPWSSACAHLTGHDATGMLDMARWSAAFKVEEWRRLLGSQEDEQETEQLRRSTHTGRPWGDEAFVSSLELTLGRTLRPQKRGPKPKASAATPSLWEQ